MSAVFTEARATTVFTILLVFSVLAYAGDTAVFAIAHTVSMYANAAVHAISFAYSMFACAKPAAFFAIMLMFSVWA